MQEFDTKVDHSFGYTPDTAYFMLDGMFCQGLSVAPELTLNHIGNYNWHDEWNIPVAPEAYRRDRTLLETNTRTSMLEKFCCILKV